MTFRTLGYLVDGLEHEAAAPAVIGHRRDGSAVWSRGELRERARALAAGLREAGVAPGDLVGLLAPNQPEWVMAFLATVRAGAIAMPLSEQITAPELERIVAHSGCRRFFTTAAFVETLTAAAEHGGRRDLDLILLDDACRIGRARGAPGLAGSAARRHRGPARARPRPARGAGLHLRHHRHAQRRPAQPPQPLRQHPGSAARGAGGRRRPRAPAAAAPPRLSAHGRAAFGAGGRRRGGPAERDQRARDQPRARRVPLHDHGRRAAALRGDAGRDRKRAQGPRAADPADLPGSGGAVARAPPPLRSAARPGPALAAASPARPGAAPARLGRRPARAGDRLAARRLRLAGADRLWPDRDRADPDLQSARPRPPRQRRAAGRRRRAAHRATGGRAAGRRGGGERGRVKRGLRAGRDPGPRPERVRGLLAQSRGDRRSLHRRRLLPHGRPR